MNMFTYMQTYTQMYMHMQTQHKYIYTHTHALVYINAHTYKWAYTHTHTQHICMFNSNARNSNLLTKTAIFLQRSQLNFDKQQG